MLLGVKIFIVLAIITLLIPTGATLVLSSRISREEEVGYIPNKLDSKLSRQNANN